MKTLPTFFLERGENQQKAEADYSNRPRRREHNENARKRLEVTSNSQFAVFTDSFLDLHIRIVITTLLSLKGAKVSHN